MFNHIFRIGMAFLLLGVIQNAYGQKATEIYIPVGKSPGLSGKYTTIGKVSAINHEEQTISMSDSAGSYNVRITDSTKVWLDRSKLKLSTHAGSFKDIVQGLLAEVKYRDNGRGADAEWIKVQMTEQK